MTNEPLKATQPLPASDLLPISYRPDPMDDWGTIRAAPGATGADGVAWTLARIRDPRVPDAELWKFREAGTDPYEAVGKMFVHAVNSHHDLIEALRGLLDEVGKSACADAILDSAAAGKAFAAISEVEGRRG